MVYVDEFGFNAEFGSGDIQVFFTVLKKKTDNSSVGVLAVGNNKVENSKVGDALPKLTESEFWENPIKLFFDNAKSVDVVIERLNRIRERLLEIEKSEAGEVGSIIES